MSFLQAQSCNCWK